ncbi:MAG: hypothetical protein HYX82_05405 [Chloroflexi bacterium]|nr:hypothetical protein [Chloroflexota bacterium]
MKKLIKILKYTAYALILVSLIFIAFQVYLLNTNLSEQIEKLQEIQEGQDRLTGKMDEVGNKLLAEVQQGQDRLSGRVGDLEDKLLSAISDLRQTFRNVLGGGKDISAENPLNVTELASMSEYIPLFQNLNNFKYLGNPILEAGGPGSWDQDIHHTRLYYNPQWTHKWRIYYDGKDDSGRRTIGFAEADKPEGPYTKYAGNPVIVADQTWEKDSSVAGLAILQVEKNKYVGYYQFSAKENYLEHGIARIESEDGIVWTNKQIVLSTEPMFAGESAGVAIPVPVYDVSTGKYYLISDGLASFEGRSPAFYEFSLISESDDGITFTKKARISMFGLGYEVGPAPNTTAPNSIVKLGSLYVLLSQWHPKWGGAHNTASIVAVSRNLFDWYQYPKPVIWNSGPDEVLSGRYPSVSLVDNTLYIIYTYSGGANKYKVGLLQLPLEPPFPTQIINESALATRETVYSKVLQLEGQDLALTVEGTYNPSAKAGGILRIYTSTDGSIWDTEEIEAKTLAFAAGETRRETFSPGEAALRARFIKVAIQNLDSTHAITSVKATATLGQR